MRLVDKQELELRVVTALVDDSPRFELSGLRGPVTATGLEVEWTTHPWEHWRLRHIFIDFRGFTPSGAPSRRTRRHRFSEDDIHAYLQDDLVALIYSTKPVEQPPNVHGDLVV